jgi:hypothetical protein
MIPMIPASRYQLQVLDLEVLGEAGEGILLREKIEKGATRCWRCWGTAGMAKRRSEASKLG